MSKFLHSQFLQVFFRDVQKMLSHHFILREALYVVGQSQVFQPLTHIICAPFAQRKALVTYWGCHGDWGCHGNWSGGWNWSRWGRCCWSNNIRLWFFLLEKKRDRERKKEAAMICHFTRRNKLRGYYNHY